MWEEMLLVFFSFNQGLLSVRSEAKCNNNYFTVRKPCLFWAEVYHNLSLLLTFTK